MYLNGLMLISAVLDWGSSHFSAATTTTPYVHVPADVRRDRALPRQARRPAAA